MPSANDIYVVTYPSFFAASDTEPSTAKIRSNKACIPCKETEECELRKLFFNEL
ncbi:hypothetical protein HanPSC8_Chr02g0052251 [Helianthus annuus]|nr:hypothetical protein HanPSC8_Chr02g0052251 [Helianthus annuus]